MMKRHNFFLPILLAILFSTNIGVKSNPLGQKRTASQAGLKQQDQASRKRTKVNEENHKNA
ncbi:hypothetical protein GF322_02485 [Candidatus Dependentiae bacterium]|nr:hypothetical protein [Candidatus Dependentiae bacterium]